MPQCTPKTETDLLEFLQNNFSVIFKKVVGTIYIISVT